MTRTINYGLIGCGMMGQEHLHNIALLDGTRVVAIYEPDWRTGKAIPTRISRADGRLLGIAGLWEERKTAAGDRELSFSMLTVNADDHALMRNFHRPGHEKRMVVVLPQALYQDWLTAPAEISSEFMTQYPADRLVAYPQL